MSIVDRLREPAPPQMRAKRNRLRDTRGSPVNLGPAGTPQRVIAHDQKTLLALLPAPRSWPLALAASPPARWAPTTRRPTAASAGRLQGSPGLDPAQPTDHHRPRRLVVGLFNDPTLDAMMKKVEISNQNLAAPRPATARPAA